MFPGEQRLCGVGKAHLSLYLIYVPVCPKLILARPHVFPDYSLSLPSWLICLDFHRHFKLVLATSLCWSSLVFSPQHPPAKTVESGPAVTTPVGTYLLSQMRNT